MNERTFTDEQLAFLKIATFQKVQSANHAYMREQLYNAGSPTQEARLRKAYNRKKLIQDTYEVLCGF